MATHFSPLILSAQFQDLPQNYSQRIRLYDTKGNVSTQKHLDGFNDFIDLEEVDYVNEKNLVVCAKPLKRCKEVVQSSRAHEHLRLRGIRNIIPRKMGR